MSCSIASSSRPTIRSVSQWAAATCSRSHTQTQTRGVVHHARPPRLPVLPSPHNPRVPSPTPGTSTPQAQVGPGPASASASPTTPSVLDGTNLTFHHSPPPTAPSYTTGAVPPFLRWVNGQPVQLTGEEAAPRRRERQAESEGAGVAAPKWDSGIKRQMIEMRQRGMSRSQIAKSLSIPVFHAQHISRVAALSKKEQAEKSAELEEQKSTWGFNKRLARAKREKRKVLW